eukprot:1159282-Pelagomonas_calceolata.AAC.16
MLPPARQHINQAVRASKSGVCKMLPPARHQEREDREKNYVGSTALRTTMNEKDIRYQINQAAHVSKSGPTVNLTG